MPRSANTTYPNQPKEEKPMRLFTHISFLATLLAFLASAAMALVAIFVFRLPTNFTSRYHPYRLHLLFS